MLVEKKDIIKKYNLPKQVKFCKKCAISNQRPRITFDEKGICSACNFSIFKNTKINWVEREKELLKLCDKHRSKDGSFDVIVPCSGGKDGSYVAHQLKEKYNMNPLCVTWSPLKPTDIGKKNLSSFINSGFNHIQGTANPKITQELTRLAFNYMGDPFQPFIYGQANFPLRIAVSYKIPLIMYGENGEVEYGGDLKNAYKPTREISDQDKHYFSGLPPEFWQKHGITKQDLYPFLAPTHGEIKDSKIEIHFFSYYKFWDPQENYYYCKEKTGFSPNDERSEGTYSKYASLDDKFDGFHYYLSFIKFGIGRCTSDASHEVRDGKIDREEAIELIRRYDGEFPKNHFNEFLDFINIDEDKFNLIIDSWRSDHIWGKNSKGSWFIKNPIWGKEI